MTTAKKPAKPEATQPDGRRMPGYQQGKLNEATRERIQVSQIVTALEKHALGKGKMSATRLKAAEILLKKTLPDLSSSKVDLDSSPIMFVFGRLKAKQEQDGGV